MAQLAIRGLSFGPPQRNAFHVRRGSKGRPELRFGKAGMINSEAVPVFTQALQSEMIGWLAMGLGLLAIIIAAVKK